MPSLDTGRLRLREDLQRAPDVVIDSGTGAPAGAVA
jgi:hypothetical protein